MPFIEIQQQFPAAIEQVFTCLAVHDSYNIAFAPLQVRRVQDAVTGTSPDGVGSVRCVGLGKIKPLKEQITVLQPNERIEYRIIDNSWVAHHLGVIRFERLTATQTLVTYRIELQMRVPLISQLILAQLKTGIKLGLAKLAQTFS